MENRNDNRGPRLYSSFDSAKRNEQPRFDPDTGEPIQRTGVLKRSKNLSGEETVRAMPNGYQTEPQPRFDPETGEPIRMDHESAYEQPRFDPETGEPIHMDYEPDYQQQARFDPETGEPIHMDYEPDYQQQARFDPETGEPIGTDYEPAYEQPRFDPETGAPLFENRQSRPRKKQTSGIDLEDSFREEPEEKPAQKSNGVFITLMIILTVILLAGIGVILYFVFFNKPKDQKTEDQNGAQTTVAWPDSIVDEWTITQIEAEGKTMDAASAGMSGRFLFRNDGTVTVETDAGGNNAPATYTVSGNNVTVTAENTTIPGSYDPTTDTIVLSLGGRKMKLERSSKVQPSGNPGQASQPPSASFDIRGEWIVTKAESAGTVYTYTGRDSGMYYRFRDSGVLEAEQRGGSATGSYTVSGNNVTMTLSGESIGGVYDAAADSMRFEDADEEIVLYLERVENVPEAEKDPGQQSDPSPAEPSPGTPASAEYPFPSGGISDSLVRQYAGGFLSNSSNSYSCYDIAHQTDANGMTDKVSLSLEEERSDDTYRSDLTMTFVFHPADNTWELKSHSQTTPEAVSYTETPATFSFGGATIETGATEVDGGKLGINGSGSTYRFISKKDVEALVSMCPDLKTLKLDHCYLETYQPLSKLKKLKVLDLKECGTKYGKGEQITEIDWIAPLTNLVELRLNGNAISDLTPLENLNKLTLLNLSDNRIDDTSLESIAMLTKLEYLNLYINDISDLEPLTALENLIYLNIHQTNLSSIDFLKKMHSVTWIYVGQDYEGYPLKHFDWYNVLKACPQIQKVYVRQEDAYTTGEIEKLFNDGYIKEMKKY